jgi:S-layer protein
MTLASVATVTDINASATSGTVSVSNFDATKATYEGGSGTDSLTIATTTVSKAISLGAGNDTVVLAVGTGAIAGSIDGGAGTDTLSINAADAVNVSQTNVFASKVVGFETLAVTGGAGAQTVHVDAIGAFHSVTTGGEAAGGTLTLDGFVSGDTLTLNSSTGGGDYIVSSNAFATPTNDVFNVVLSSAGSIGAGQVTINNVETINVTATDTSSTSANFDSLTVVADSATSIKVSGGASLALTSANNTVTSIDASSLTGNLTYVAAGNKALTVTGGAGNDVISAHAGSTLADVLIGGAGNDTLTANRGLDTLTGGAGNDTFVIAEAAANVNTYSTITDFSKGDTLVFANLGTETFSAAKLTLGATAVFQDYANAAVNAGGNASVNGFITWFQYNGDTYVVESRHDVGTTADFVNGTDVVVKLVGLVDLSGATINTDPSANNGGVNHNALVMM